MLSDLKPLFMLTVKAPREAAGRVLALDLPVQGLWLALSLVSVVTSLAFAALMQAVPVSDDELGEVMRASPAYSAPLILALLQWGRAILSVFVLYWVGRILGGTGQLRDVLAVVAWLQAVTFGLMVGAVLVGVILPFVSSILILALVVWWIWAMVSVLDVAHRFDSGLKATGVLILSLLGVTLGFSIFIGTISGLFMGVS